jgi:hypothetical protein
MARTNSNSGQRQSIIRGLYVHVGCALQHTFRALRSVVRRKVFRRIAFQHSVGGSYSVSATRDHFPFNASSMFAKEFSGPPPLFIHHQEWGGGGSWNRIPGESKISFIFACKYA